jgi:Tol biopolymer transport system component
MTPHLRTLLRTLLIIPISLAALALLGARAADQSAPATNTPESSDTPAYLRIVGEPIRLTTLDSNHEYHPCFSPDGKHIAFTSRTPDTSAATIAILDLETNDITTLDFGVVGDMHFGYALNGDMLVFDARDDGGPPYICTYDFKTKKTTRITPPETVSVHPSTSPDGRYAAYSAYVGRGGRMEIMLYDCAAGTTRQLTEDGPREKGRCSWSADGKTVFFVSDNDDSSLHKVDVATGKSKRITQDAVRKSFTTCSPDNALLVYETWSGNQHDINVMPVAGGPAQSLIASPAMEGHPDFSPDGTQIVYTSTRNGSHDLWIVDVEMINSDRDASSPSS